MSKGKKKPVHVKGHSVKAHNRSKPRGASTRAKRQPRTRRGTFKRK